MADPTKITLYDLPNYLAGQGEAFVEGANYLPYMAKRGYELKGTGNQAYWEKTGTPGTVGTPVTPLEKYRNIAMTGQLPEDVVQAIQQRAAEFGVATGMPGSELAGYGGLRQLGLTSLDVLKDAAKYDITPYNQALLEQSNLNQSQKMQLALEEASNQRNAQLADIWRQTTGTSPGYTMGGGGYSMAPTTKTQAASPVSSYGGYTTSPYGTSSSPLMTSAPPSTLDVLLSAINQGTSPASQTDALRLQTSGGFEADNGGFGTANLDWVNAPFGGYEAPWTEEQDYWTI